MNKPFESVKAEFSKFGFRIVGITLDGSRKLLEINCDLPGDGMTQTYGDGNIVLAKKGAQRIGKHFAKWWNANFLGCFLDDSIKKFGVDEVLTGPCYGHC